jgi:hypothetical protein
VETGEPWKETKGGDAVSCTDGGPGPGPLVGVPGAARYQMRCDDLSSRLPQAGGPTEAADRPID